MTWRVAKSLETLRTQINTLSPNRNKASDGAIGDAKHASRSSDHNPWVMDGKTGIVTGLDITHDPAHGINSQKIADALVASKDKRIKYIISNGKIVSGAGESNPAWVWRKYNGANPHTKHVHISVQPEKVSYDDTSPWVLDIKVTPTQVAKPPVKAKPLLKKGSKLKTDVEHLQKLLGFTGKNIDGVFGKNTETAVKAFQAANKLVADGKVGTYTWDALEKKFKQKETKEMAAKKKTETNVTPSPLVGGLVGGIAISVLREVIGKALTTASNDPNMPVTKDKVKELTESIVEKVAPAVQNKIAPKVEAEVQAIETNANNDEPWYKSRVVLGTIASLLSLGLGFVGVQVGVVEQGQIVDLILTASGLISGAYVLYGRLKSGLKPLGE